MCPAIMRIVRRGAPGTVAAQRPGGKCSKRKRVMRLLVLQAAKIASRRSGGEGITHLSTMTALMPNDSRLRCGPSACRRKEPRQTDDSFVSRPRQLQALVRPLRPLALRLPQERVPRAIHYLSAGRTNRHDRGHDWDIKAVRRKSREKAAVDRDGAHLRVITAQADPISPDERL